MARLAPIAPCLWFDNDALDAAEFYCAVFPDSRVTDVWRATDGVFDPDGQVLFVLFELNGQPFQALNGGPLFTFSEAISFCVECRDQEEIDYFWDALQQGGGQPVECGWLKDRYGLSWQVVPQGFEEMMRHPEKRRAAQAMAAMYTMQKFDIAALEEAFNADPA
jgi:predicted 3-demethylubiquinone-9 3-methyltransferase (glyoxalase superfamily)